MAAPSTTLFKKTVIRAQPKSVYTDDTADSKFWTSFDFPITKKEYGPISDVQFSPMQPYTYAVASSSRFQIYSCETNQITKTFSKFKEAVNCARFRHDGSLIVAGTEAGLAKVYDIERKLCLRMLKGHTSAIHAAEFLYDGHRVLTCSDDRSSIVWDLATSEKLFTFKEHNDHVRSCAVSRAARDIFLTGSYDGTAKLLDSRTGNCIQTVDHKAPIEDVTMFQSGTVYLTAGGNSVKLWDSLAGGKLMMELVNHHKTVMCLNFTSDYKRLLTAGLDRHVKVYDTSSYQVVHTLDFPAPVISLGLSGDDRCFVVGMSDGMLSVRKKRIDGELTKVERKQKAFHSKIQKFSFKPSKNAHIIQHNRKEHLAKYDSYLKSFQHSKALDAVLEARVRMKQPEVTVGLIEELIRRDAIKAAVAGRDEKSLDVLIRFLSKHITNPQYMKTMIDITNVLLDVYSEHTDRLSGVINRLMALSNIVSNEIKYEEQLLQLLGTMDAILSMSNTSTDNIASSKPLQELEINELDS